jgi:hypothetical protein
MKGASPGAAGPSMERARSPWPTTTSSAPTGRLAVAHEGQCTGRTAPHDGRRSIQDSTSISE